MKNNKKGEIVSIAVSEKKGVPKTVINSVKVIENHGIEDDAHAGFPKRQVSFLSSESINIAKDEGLDVSYGDFAENFATKGIEWKELPLGTMVNIGDSVVVEITQIGKECHNRCAIYYQAGDCIMPKEGIFGTVIKGGEVSVGDNILIS
ncbi:MAG: MOSC domain-containing protein [Desulfobacterales bacterium]|nr:MOSC domain-containing protein [Desulfobacterales bacterium]MCP4163423.1 MOSC domain-containing protein [Deltaproteobacteria bacterium]